MNDDTDRPDQAVSYDDRNAALWLPVPLHTRVLAAARTDGLDEASLVEAALDALDALDGKRAADGTAQRDGWVALELPSAVYGQLIDVADTMQYDPDTIVSEALAALVAARHRPPPDAQAVLAMVRDELTAQTTALVAHISMLARRAQADPAQAQHLGVLVARWEAAAGEAETDPDAPGPVAKVAATVLRQCAEDLKQIPLAQAITRHREGTDIPTATEVWQAEYQEERTAGARQLRAVERERPAWPYGQPQTALEAQAQRATLQGMGYDASTQQPPADVQHFTEAAVRAAGQRAWAIHHGGPSMPTPDQVRRGTTCGSCCHAYHYAGHCGAVPAPLVSAALCECMSGPDWQGANDPGPNDTPHGLADGPVCHLCRGATALGLDGGWKHASDGTDLCMSLEDAHGRFMGKGGDMDSPVCTCPDVPLGQPVPEGHIHLTGCPVWHANRRDGGE